MQNMWQAIILFFATIGAGACGIALTEFVWWLKEKYITSLTRRRV